MYSRVPLNRGRAPSKALFSSALLASLLCACSGSSQVLVPAQAVSPVAADASDTPAGRSGDAKLELSVLIPRGRSRADYVSRSTRSIVVTEGKRRLRPVNTVAPSRSCSVQSAGTLCLFHLGVLSGPKESFVINTYDLKYGHGKVLSTGRITKLNSPRRAQRAGGDPRRRSAFDRTRAPKRAAVGGDCGDRAVERHGERRRRQRDRRRRIVSQSDRNRYQRHARGGYGIPVNGDRSKSNRYAFVQRPFGRKRGDRCEFRRRCRAERNRCDVRPQAHGRRRLLRFDSGRNPRTAPAAVFLRDPAADCNRERRRRQPVGSGFEYEVRAGSRIDVGSPDVLSSREEPEHESAAGRNNGPGRGFRRKRLVRRRLGYRLHFAELGRGHRFPAHERGRLSRTERHANRGCARVVRRRLGNAAVRDE